MAKGHSGKSGRSARKPAAQTAKVERQAAAADGGRPRASARAEAKAAGKVRKHVSSLRRQLADAARQEAKRLRQLERARNRRELLEAAIDELSGAVPAGTATAKEPLAATRSASEASPAHSAASASAGVSERRVRARRATSRTVVPPGAPEGTKESGVPKV